MLRICHCRKKNQKGLGLFFMSWKSSADVLSYAWQTLRSSHATRPTLSIGLILLRHKKVGQLFRLRLMWFCWIAVVCCWFVVLGCSLKNDKLDESLRGLKTRSNHCSLLTVHRSQSSYKKQQQHNRHAAKGEIKALFKDGGAGTEHPESRDHKEKQRQAEKDVQVK